MDPKVRFKRFLFFLTLFLIVLVFAITDTSNSRDNVKKEVIESNTKYINIAGKTIQVDLALTKEARGKGLSGRTMLNDDEGMLFVFDSEEKHSFWMKDMNFSIDIIWIGSDLQVVYIKENVSPNSYPEGFLPDESAKYVLEVNGGFSEKNNLKEGDSVIFLPQ